MAKEFPITDLSKQTCQAQVFDQALIYVVLIS